VLARRRDGGEITAPAAADDVLFVASATLAPKNLSRCRQPQAPAGRSVSGALSAEYSRRWRIGPSETDQQTKGVAGVVSEMSVTARAAKAGIGKNVAGHGRANCASCWQLLYTRQRFALSGSPMWGVP